MWHFNLDWTSHKSSKFDILKITILYPNQTSFNLHTNQIDFENPWPRDIPTLGKSIKFCIVQDHFQKNLKLKVKSDQKWSQITQHLDPGQF